LTFLFFWRDWHGHWLSSPRSTSLPENSAKKWVENWDYYSWRLHILWFLSKCMVSILSFAYDFLGLPLQGNDRITRKNHSKWLLAGCEYSQKILLFFLSESYYCIAAHLIAPAIHIRCCNRSKILELIESRSCCQQKIH
jgi:hypothetical protein